MTINISKTINYDKKDIFRTQRVSEVLAEWHHMINDNMGDAKEVILRGRWPPITEMDSSLSLLVNCEVLSISLNMIEKISNLEKLSNLRVLSLAQNNIKFLDGLESVCETLEILIIARNFLKHTKGIENLFKLKQLDISYNYINHPLELLRLGECVTLKDLAFQGNPLAEKYSADVWRQEALKVLPKLQTLDYIKVKDQEKFSPAWSKILNQNLEDITCNYHFTDNDDFYKEALHKICG